jgi:hypothetical protein
VRRRAVWSIVGALAVCLATRPVAASDRGPHVVAALREALHLAVERGLATVARPDGFLGTPAIRLPIPEQLGKVEAKLRLAGQERRVERFETSLNRAAEDAAPATRPVLLAAVAELPLDDGHRVLTGGDTAGTETLKRHALGRVIIALNPAVAVATDRLGTARRFKRFMKDAQFGGLVQAPSLDLDAYVVGRTADGIFHAIGQEERRIRIDPAARVTPLMREVFGSQR